MIICNCRCLNDKFTGIQRYTTEILARLPQIVKVSPPPFFSGKGGHVWEQFFLPLQTGRNLLWNPSNTGPLLAPTRQVVTLHDLATIFGHDSQALPTRTKYYAWMLPRLLARVEGVLTVSEYSRTQIIETFNFSPDRILATPLGVDHARFRPHSETEIAAFCASKNLTPGYVLSLGSGSARKNLGGLLNAWRMIQNEIDDRIELVITGDGAAYGRAFDGTVIPPLPPRARLIGRIPDGDLPALMASAGVFAFPSFYEGFGLPPLEAMACGTPTVVSNTTSIPEVVGDAAISIDPHDTEMIASGLKRVLTDKDLQAHLRAAGLVQASRFNWNNTAQRTLEFLEANG